MELKQSLVSHYEISRRSNYKWVTLTGNVKRWDSTGGGEKSTRLSSKSSSHSHSNSFVFIKFIMLKRTISKRKVYLSLYLYLLEKKKKICGELQNFKEVDEVVRRSYAVTVGRYRPILYVRFSEPISNA